MLNDVERCWMMLDDFGCWVRDTVSTHHQHLIQQASREAWYSVTDMGTSLRDRLVRTLIPNHVENKRNVEWLLEKRLNAFKLI